MVAFANHKIINQKGVTMFRSAFGIILYITAISVPASSATLPAREVTADGTWDCKQQDGTYIGAVAIVEKNYAFIKPDARLGGYGKLFGSSNEYLDLPSFAVIDGFLKDKFSVSALAMRGPKGHEADISGELFMHFALSTKGPSELDWDCMRRKGP